MHESTDGENVSNPEEKLIEQDTTPPQTENRSWLITNRKWIILGLLFVLLVLVGQRGLVVVLKAFFEWVQSIGFWGNVMFILMFFVVSFPFVLGGYIPLTMGAGSLYGVLIGTITVSVGSTLGGVMAFWICKKFMEKCVDTSTLKSTSHFQLFASMLKMSENTMFVTLLARWAPMPFGLQNIFFVLADVPFQNFFLVTWLGLLPLQLLYAYFGATLRSLTKIASGEVELDHLQKISIVLQVVVVIGLIGYFVYLSRKMRRMQQQQQDHSNVIELQTVQPEV